MSRKQRSNPIWVEALVHRFCDEIDRIAKKHDLPLPLFDGPCQIDPRSELGEGSYGVVYETDALDCVFKATTDSTEAHFVQTLINLRKDEGIDPAGVVDYRAVFGLPAQHREEKIFILWREKAVSVGLPENVSKSDTSMVKFIQAMNDYYKAAEGDPNNKRDLGAYWLAVQQQHNVGEAEYWQWLKERVKLANRMIDGRREASQGSAMADRLFRAYVAAKAIEESGPDGRYVGEMLRTYFEQGVLISDLHANNVGIVERRGRRIWVCTDAGHNLILSEKLRNIGIPTLKEARP